MVLWPVETSKDVDFGEAIARKIYEKAAELVIVYLPEIATFLAATKAIFNRLTP